MAKKNSLGRGLDALISTEPIKTVGSSSIGEIDLDKISVNADQPRCEFDPEAMEELTVSIRKLGIIQPITVREIDNGHFQIISGERRFRAAKLAGFKSIPAYIKTADDDKMMEMALIENIQREDLNAIEIALSYQKLSEVYNLTHEKLSEQLGKKRTTISNYIRLLKLPAEIQMGLKDKKINMGHARALINISSPAIQLDIYENILKYGYSVRKVEEIVRKMESEEPDKKKQAKKISGQYKELQQQLSEKFDTKVRFTIDENGKGNINIPFKSEEKLEKILSYLDKILH